MLGGTVWRERGWSPRANGENRGMPDGFRLGGSASAHDPASGKLGIHTQQELLSLIEASLS